MRAVITVVGKDAVGILAKVSGRCSDHRVNVIEVTQSILQDMFAMIMMVDTSGCSMAFKDLAELLRSRGESRELVIRIQREDIFEAMHRV